MDVFKPDIFSSPRPAFQAADADVSAMISSVLSRHYGFDPEEINAVECLVGLEVNSKNFKVGVGADFYALKRAGTNVSIDNCGQQLRVTQLLLERGVSVPHVINSNRNAPYAIHDDGTVWILSRFIEGPYFSGSLADYQSSASAIRKLQDAVEGLAEAQELPVSASAHAWEGTVAIFDDFFRREAEWQVLFPATDCQLLVQEQDRIRDCLVIASLHEQALTHHIVPTHIDLHPHNILMQDGHLPIIVDIDSFQRTDRTQSLAFAAFKLTRQYIVHENPTDRAAPVREFLQTLGAKSAEVDFYYHGAMVEVLRRVGIIVSLNMYKSNREWNRVLPLQLAALHELPYIFGKDV